jgi:hypothetical protein
MKKYLKRFLKLILPMMLLMLVFASPVSAQSGDAQIGLQSIDIVDIFDITAFVKTAAVGAIPLVLVILGLVEFTRKAGAKGKTLTYISMVIGLLLGTGYMITQQRPPVTSDWFPVYIYWFGTGIYGVFMGLVASGLFDVIKNRLKELIATLKE